MRRTWIATLAGVWLAAPAGGVSEDPDEVVAWSVAVVTAANVAYDGIVERSPRTDALFTDNEEIDPALLPPRDGLTLDGFNGLSGSIQLRFGDMKSIRRVDALTRADMAERRERRQVARESRMLQEIERLRLVHEERAVRAAEQAAADARSTAAGGPLELPVEALELLERFPPADGWVPAKKAQLYYEMVILNSRPPTEEERAWLDLYDSWKQAYDLWLLFEEERLRLEEEAAAAADASVPSEPAAPPPPGPDGD